MSTPKIVPNHSTLTLANELPWKFSSVFKDISNVWCLLLDFKSVIDSRVRKGMFSTNYDRIASKHYNILNSIQPPSYSTKLNNLIIADNFMEMTPYSSKTSMNCSQVVLFDTQYLHWEQVLLLLTVLAVGFLSLNR